MSVMQEMKQTNLESLQQDSLDQTNQLTTREWVRVREPQTIADYVPTLGARQMITSDKWNDYLNWTKCLQNSWVTVVVRLK